MQEIVEKRVAGMVQLNSSSDVSHLRAPGNRTDWVLSYGTILMCPICGRRGNTYSKFHCIHSYQVQARSICGRRGTGG